MMCYLLLVKETSILFAETQNNIVSGVKRIHIIHNKMSQYLTRLGISEWQSRSAYKAPQCNKKKNENKTKKGIVSRIFLWSMLDHPLVTSHSEHIPICWMQSLKGNGLRCRMVTIMSRILCSYTRYELLLV